jgi:hypothetical protein
MYAIQRRSRRNRRLAATVAFVVAAAAEHCAYAVCEPIQRTITALAATNATATAAAAAAAAATCEQVTALCIRRRLHNVAHAR